MPRNYGQFCALSRALDLVGERWTLLVVRELILGPRRYGQLLDALPGIGTNLLAARLSAMVEQGVCSREGREYALTARGRELEPAVLALARWGMGGMAPPGPTDHMRPDWYAVAMLAAYTPTSEPVPERYEFEVAGGVFHLVVGDGPPRARRGPAEAPSLRLRADLPTFLAVVTGRCPLSAAEWTGDRSAAERWLAAFALPLPAPASPQG